MQSVNTYRVLHFLDEEDGDQGLIPEPWAVVRAVLTETMSYRVPSATLRPARLGLTSSKSPSFTRLV